MTNEIEILFLEIRHLFHQLVRVGDALHEDENVTMGMRAVLELLAKHGPMTVPDMARSRSVSRQHIQVLVNSVVEKELTELVENPAHRRSSLVQLTPLGRKIIERMRKREARMFRNTDFGVKPRDVERAARTLQSIRSALEELP